MCKEGDQGGGSAVQRERIRNRDRLAIGMRIRGKGGGGVVVQTVK